MTHNLPDLDTYQTQGYLIARQLFCPEAMAELQAMVERIHRQWAAENGDLIRANRLLNMHSLTDSRYFKAQAAERLALFAWITQPAITGWLTGLFGDELHFHNSQLFFNPLDREQLPYWHRDLQYSTVTDEAQQSEQGSLLALHLRVPLLSECGMAVVPGSHRRWDNHLEREVRFELNGHQKHEDLPGSVFIDLQPGDALLFDAQMLHRGHYQSNSARLAFDICVGNYHPFTAAFLNKAVLPDQAEMGHLANHDWYRRAWQTAEGLG
ncbi:phytanoyl-CoA dioxygenase family protein [Methylomonas sp. ZR1]|uniref:phytanoyl-CoA dioxygenase family protein n=1 Tax=unclassified Methylomonas TaxID=2608980 RepID=UPI0014925541|nr:phytanoyl-CoA dioxygenase family protein [Methylomonas sp. ZR1]NOV29732.1 phytanoyl-CoA dioxygenase [Methylomonas sp. ZR1]